MYLTAAQIGRLEQALGTPRVERGVFSVGAEELAMVRSSQKYGRAHDFTFFVFNAAGQLAVVRKPSFPPGAFRAPSGGVKPGEEILEACRREMYEETGLHSRFTRYLLRINAAFRSGDDELPWTTHVMLGQTDDAAVEIHDTDEIAEARFASLDELQGAFRNKLLAAGRGLMRYRVTLTDWTVDLLANQECAATKDW